MEHDRTGDRMGYTLEHERVERLELPGELRRALVVERHHQLCDDRVRLAERETFRGHLPVLERDCARAKEAERTVVEGDDDLYGRRRLDATALVLSYCERHRLTSRTVERLGVGQVERGRARRYSLPITLLS